ncbi:unnamed protein product [Paramecium octaurelia]|uniref:Uncharacterized protein n=1 Tax=Paramecium octaurelia TaxID=43137 RepID=A0A8S1W187_PAROT|nr:unnamed protein product [Paramecium octaurelia]
MSVIKNQQSHEEGNNSDFDQVDQSPPYLVKVDSEVENVHYKEGSEVENVHYKEGSEVESVHQKVDSKVEYVLYKADSEYVLYKVDIEFKQLIGNVQTTESDFGISQEIRNKTSHSQNTQTKSKISQEECNNINNEASDNVQKSQRSSEVEQNTDEQGMVIQAQISLSNVSPQHVRIPPQGYHLPKETKNIYKAFYGGLKRFMMDLPKDIIFSYEAVNFLNTPLNKFCKARLFNSINKCPQMRNFAEVFFCNYQWPKYLLENNKINLDRCFRICPQIIAELF